MAWYHGGVPCPKPSATRLVQKDTAKKLDERLLRRFRREIWIRDEGKCRLCGRMVKRTLALDPLRGECHHIRGRRVAPEDRYNTKTALLLCLSCHQAKHAGKA